jgi:hypothetical protein
MAFIEASSKTATADEILATMRRALVLVQQRNLTIKEIPCHLYVSRHSNHWLRVSPGNPSVRKDQSIRGRGRWHDVDLVRKSINRRVETLSMKSWSVTVGGVILLVVGAIGGHFDALAGLLERGMVVRRGKEVGWGEEKTRVFSQNSCRQARHIHSMCRL